MAYFNDRQFNRDVCRYADAEIKKYKTVKQMMNKAQSEIAYCRECDVGLSMYGAELIDRLIDRLRDALRSGKTNEAETEQINSLIRAYYDLKAKTD